MLAAMGNHTDSDDYGLYARPTGDQAQESVQIVDDGGTVPSAVGRAAGGSRASGRDNGSARADGSTWVEDAGTSGRADGAHGASVPGGSSASHGLSASDGPWRRFNPYLCAAWALVAMILATGAAWLTGAFDPPSYVSVDPATGRGMAGRPGILVSNLYSMGPFLLLIGLIGAFTLLTVQADRFRRVHGR